MELSTKESLDGKRDYLRVAHTLRDKLNGLITSKATGLATQRQILLVVLQELELILAHARSCCKHEQIMNPDLWSTLPMELLQCVFAKLPISDICRLKSLSKEWQLSLQSSSSEFTQALKESSPEILGQVTLHGSFRFWLHVLDGRTNRWHALHAYVPGCPGNQRLMISVSNFVHMDGAADGGLVCYVEKDFETSLNRIFVTNPMTGVVNPLPNLEVLMCSELTMMRIIVDRNTHHYKVIVVKRGPPVEAELYDSKVRQWTKPEASLGRIFGIAHDWSRHGNVWKARKLGPCAYDCRDGKYYNFGQIREKWLEKDRISYTLMEDRLFVLYWDPKELTAFISEYYVPDNATSWVKKETPHNCFPRFSRMLDVIALRKSRIHACNGFLFMFEGGGPSFDAEVELENRIVYAGVYDLATCEWRELPRSPSWSTCQTQSVFTSVMCELHWNILP